ncbi:lysM and putative peptidoglycan-binding domain-containing protein 4-like [Periophthalmus magnuspinnatus]|uniref:lysM and putative peptidoglycan-binding domain-containing protein 4-like n=1 Tax=Periophthalmus magnuspinnatus TaxID=409849 RepID=UPI00243720B5|nr:lysM and putative peptidoglycan-binding domain-containing protein 4-like [Periophthalmus magnuspinnatus]
MYFSTKVADIKRLNNLIQKQDLIKIPVQKHSFLTEDLMPSHPHLMPSQPHLRRALPQHPHMSGELAHFLMELDNGMERLIQSTEQEDEELLEVWDRREHRGHRRQRSQGVKGQGADWGINCWNAVIAMLLVGIVLLLFYIIYFKTRPSEGGPAVHPLVTNSSGPAGGSQGPVQEPG